ncbi:MAG: hypothetical protein KAW12_30555 [Candidatus Aminicenantes bacterium]|nr:hypothetical protein [Candidatus Aminicenantes bacterium]
MQSDGFVKFEFDKNTDYREKGNRNLIFVFAVGLDEAKVKNAAIRFII